jgi:hypothetical protein
MEENANMFKINDHESLEEGKNKGDNCNQAMKI